MYEIGNFSLIFMSYNPRMVPLFNGKFEFK